MSWDGSGSFTRTNGTHTGATTWANSRDAGNNITASLHDTHDQDLADGINACLTKNGENGPTGNFRPDNDDARDLGTSAKRWRRLYLSGYIGDGNGNEVLIVGSVASAVNEVTVTNAATGTPAKLSATGGDTNVGLRLQPKGTGTVQLTDGTDTSKVASFDASAVATGKTRTITVPNSDVALGMPAMHMQGNTYGNGDGAGAGDQTNDITIAAGSCKDATGAVDMVCTALTKQLDAAWAVGSAAGGLDTGAIGNSDYYIWRIKRSDTSVVDALFSLSSTAPTMPANYDFKRLVGWFKRVAGTIVAFHTYETEGGGIEMNWDVPTLDVNLANTLGQARTTSAVKVPQNFPVIANLNVVIQDAAVTSTNQITCPDQTDAAPSTSAAPLGNMVQAVAGTTQASQIIVRTSATGTIAARSTAVQIDTYAVSTQGFRWARRN